MRFKRLRRVVHEVHKIQEVCEGGLLKVEKGHRMASDRKGIFAKEGYFFALQLFA